MSDPTYLLWTPRVLPAASSSEAEVRCNVTPYAAGRFPRGPASFFERVAADLGLNERLVARAVTPYRSSYHGDPAPDPHWTDRWKINWLVSLRFAVEDPDAFHRHGSFAEGYETWAHAPDERADDAGTEGTAATTECRIVADFPTRAEAEQAAGASTSCAARRPPVRRRRLSRSSRSRRASGNSRRASGTSTTRSSNRTHPWREPPRSAAARRGAGQPSTSGCARSAEARWPPSVRCRRLALAPVRWGLEEMEPDDRVRTSHFGEVPTGAAHVALMDGGIHGIQGHSLFVEPSGVARWERRLDGLQPSGQAGRGTLSLSEEERAWLAGALEAAAATARGGETSFFPPGLSPPRWVWAIVLRDGARWILLEGGGVDLQEAPPSLASLLRWLQERVDRAAHRPAPSLLARLLGSLRRGS